MKKTSLLFLSFLFFFSGLSMAQQPEMADAMRSNGKIYVVIGVIAIILTGLLVFLMIIDQKVRKLEQKRKE